MGMRGVIHGRDLPARGLWRRPPCARWTCWCWPRCSRCCSGCCGSAPALNAPFLPKTAPSTVSTDPANLPYYAVRSLLRMFIGADLSVIFTFVYATAAARLRRAEKVLIPLLDILQSVPVLGFLSVTVTAFINLFPGSELGLECASIFAIFTSMAWNMTFAFYHSLISQPRDLDEAARIMRLTKWQRFWRLDVPVGDDPAGVERDAELRRRLVLPGRLGVHHRAEPSLRAARHRLLRGRRDRAGQPERGRASPSAS